MILRVLLIVAPLLLGIDLYIYLCYIRHLSISPLLKKLYWLPSCLLIGGLLWLTGFGDANFISEHPQLAGYFIIVLLLCLLPKFQLTICSLVGLPFRYLFHWPKTPFTYAGLLLGSLSIGVMLYGTLVGRTRFDLNEVAFQSSRLPQAFDGYRIIQLSDIHIGSFGNDTASIRRAVNLVNAQQADLIVFTGDLVNSRAEELAPFQEILSQLRATDGVYSILGNHDYGSYYRWDSPRQLDENLEKLKQSQAEMGWKMLNNAHAVLHRGGDSIALVGVENEGEPPFSQHGDLPRALEGTAGMFQLLLSHNPSHWKREVLPHSTVDLMLAGHTHAMQLAIGNYSFSSLIYPEWGGLYPAEDERALYVNIGLGYVGYPFRFGAWPEITVITLQQKR